MKILQLGATLFVGLVACGDPTPCDDALDKVESCGIEGLELNDSGDECAAYASCQAGCINKGSCNDLKDVVANPLADNEVNRCLVACGQ